MVLAKSFQSLKIVRIYSGFLIKLEYRAWDFKVRRSVWASPGIVKVIAEA